MIDQFFNWVLYNRIYVLKIKNKMFSSVSYWFCFAAIIYFDNPEPFITGTLNILKSWFLWHSSEYKVLNIAKQLKSRKYTLIQIKKHPKESSQSSAEQALCFTYQLSCGIQREDQYDWLKSPNEKHFLSTHNQPFRFEMYRFKIS